MPNWDGSDRRSRLPADWGKIRHRIMKRDKGVCQAKMRDGKRCGDIATDVDHIRAGDDHSPENLQALCEWHHKQKSSGEGAAALARKKRAIRNKFKRVEGHPGLV